MQIILTRVAQAFSKAFHALRSLCRSNANATGCASGTLAKSLCYSFFLLPLAAHATSGNWADEPNRDTAWPADWNASPLTITNEQQLAQFAWWVNEGTDFNGKTVEVTKDLDMSDHYWTPAGMDYGGWESNFLGTFDGQGHSIQGITITINGSGAMECAGLFGETGGKVQNVHLVDTDVVVNHATMFIGGVVGYNNGILVNCSNSGVISVDYIHPSGGLILSSGIHFIGGVVGHNLGVIENCSNNSAVNAISEGVTFAGGVAGGNINSEGVIVNCSNSGTVNVFTYDYSETSCAGGVAGDNSGIIANCMNSGAVDASPSSYESYAGGVAGRNSGTILNCYWKRDGTEGLDNDAIEFQHSGTTNNLYSFDVAPGTLSFTHPDYGMKDLLAVLNTWVAITNATLGADTYAGWKVAAGVNNGYPFLDYPNGEKPFSSGINISTITVDDSRNVVLGFAYALSHLTTKFIFEVSADLKTWTPYDEDSYPTTITRPVDGSHVRIDASILPKTPSVFFKARVVRRD